MTLVIEQGVPIPPPKGGAGMFAAMRLMKVGDSFLIPSEVKSPATVAGAANAKLRGKHFTSRKTAEGTRVWRVS